MEKDKQKKNNEMAESNNNVASNHSTDPSTAAATPVAAAAAAPATAAPKKAPFVSSAELRGAFLPWLQEFYRFHDPTRVPLTVVHALERRGDERDFMQELIKKFGNSPIQYPQFRNAFLQQQPLPTRTQASSPPPPNPSKDRLRLRVFRFYQYYRVMDKLPMVDSIAEAYWRSEELVMMETLRTKYGPEPVMHADMVLRLPGRRQRGVALVDPKRRGVWRPKPVDAQKEAAKADSDLKAFLLQKEKSEQSLPKQSAAAADTTSPSSPSASPLPPAAAATSPAQPTSPSFVEQQAIPSSGGGHAKTVDDDLDEFLGLDDDVPPPPGQEGGDDDVVGDIASGSLWRREGGGPPSTRREDDEAETKRIRDRVRNLIINDELL